MADVQQLLEALENALQEREDVRQALPQDEDWIHVRFTDGTELAVTVEELESYGRPLTDVPTGEYL